MLVVTESLEPTGGGSAIAAWTIHALQDAYDVTAVTWRPRTAQEMNRFFGTGIAPGRLRVRAAPAALRWLVAALRGRCSMLRMALLVAYARRLARDFDVVVSTDAELDLGRAAIQYVNSPGRFLWQGLPRPTAVTRLTSRLYFALVDLIAPASLDRIRRNTTLVNSDWTAARARAVLGVQTTTLFPPVAGGFEDIPWEAREPAFVCIGRMSRDKRLEEALEVVAAVRARHPEVRFHLISPAAADATYRYEMRARLAAAGDWATLHEDLSRSALCRLVSRCRYGIHAMDGEPFGIAVGEMVLAGCIVWVRREGGPCEIVGGDPRLLWDTPAEACDKIHHVLGNPAIENDLRARLAARIPALGTDRFVERIRALVDGF